MGDAGEFVECQGCKGTFVPRVLDYNPAQGENEFQAVYEQAMRHSMILMMLADGEIDENEMLTVQKIINKFGHNDVTLDQLEDLTKRVQKNKEPIGTYLSKIKHSLNEHGKEIIIKCAFAVAAADGHIDDSEKALIQEIAQEMEMSSSHIKGIIMEMNETEKENSFSQN